MEKLSLLQQAKVVAHAAKRRFVSDGCTGVPDFDFGADCCLQHDRDYWSGDVGRKTADKRLRACIRAKGYVLLPWIFYFGVRIFGRVAWAHYRAAEAVLDDTSENN